MSLHVCNYKQRNPSVMHTLGPAVPTTKERLSTLWKWNTYVSALMYGRQPVWRERRKEKKKRQLRDLNPGCLAVAAITTVPRATTATSLSQFSFHTQWWHLYVYSIHTYQHCTTVYSGALKPMLEGEFYCFSFIQILLQQRSTQ